MKVLAVGASRNIGYYASLSLLKEGHTVVFLLRNPSVFESDAEIQSFVTSGHAILIQGDALNEEEVRNAWAQAGNDVELVLFTVGGTPNFSITKGFVLTPVNLCTIALLNILSTYPSSETSQKPRIIAISSHGVTKATHATLPLLTLPIMATIKAPHADKRGMERLVYHAAAITPEWDERDTPGPDILPAGWEESAGPKGRWSGVVIRAALLTDGKETGKHRTGPALKGMWTISRRDVAHFIVNDLLKNWSTYEGQGISVGY